MNSHPFCLHNIQVQSHIVGIGDICKTWGPVFEVANNRDMKAKNYQGLVLYKMHTETIKVFAKCFPILAHIMPLFVISNAGTGLLEVADDDSVQFLDGESTPRGNCRHFDNYYDLRKEYFTTLRIMQSSKPIPRLNFQVFGNAQ